MVKEEMSRSNSHSVKQGRRKTNIASSAESRTPTLMAAALQDHLARQYCLSLNPSTSNAGKRPLKQGGLSTQQHRVPASSQRGVTMWGTNGSTMQGSHAIRGGKTAVSAASHRRREKAKVTLSRAEVTKKEAEYVLDKAPPPLTLAQRMGLVGAPPRLLDERRWKEVKESSNLRNDSVLPCPICQENFGLSTQVLLSCSHVFHLSCLTAFERFSQKKRCPLCRAENYQKRVVYEGANCWKHRAAAIIQSHWRGYRVRQWYRNYRDSIPPTHPALRAKHFERKLATLTSRMVDSCEQRTSQAQCLLAQSDANMRAARAAMRLCNEQLVAAKLDWGVVFQKAKEHVASDCAVCLCPLVIVSRQHPLNLEQQPRPPHPAASQPRPPHPAASQPHPTQTVRQLSVLSCGHVLHEVCIEALERFAVEDTPHLCPLCRALYRRKTADSALLTLNNT